MDFHGGSKLSKLTYPIKTIYSKEARVQLRKVLDDFKPDVCHLNNFNYQLTPSIILEIVKWRKETGRNCKIIFTAHDYQLVCPNHMLNNPNTHQNCEKCLGGHFVNCMKGKCIHGSTAKSAIGMMEAEFWKPGEDARVKLLDNGTEAAFWWLRSPGINGKQAAYVNFEGTCYSNYATNWYISARPAMWIDLEKLENL